MQRPVERAQLTTTQWLKHEYIIRQIMVDLFQIPRSSGTAVEDNKVVSDGYTHDDLAHITIAKMQKYTGSDSTNFEELRDLTFDKVYATYEDRKMDEIKKKEEAEADTIDDKASLVAQLSKEIDAIVSTLPKRKGRPPKDVV